MTPGFAALSRARTTSNGYSITGVNEEAGFFCFARVPCVTKQAAASASIRAIIKSVLVRFEFFMTHVSPRMKTDLHELLLFLKNTRAAFLFHVADWNNFLREVLL